MAVSLKKGGKVSLAKVAADAGIASLQEVLAGLSWDANSYDSGHDYDLDGSVFMLDASGQCPRQECFVFYNNLSQPGVQHMGDERTGAAAGDDEQILIKLNEVPTDIEKIAFVVTINDAEKYGQSFGQVENASIHLCDNVSGTELARYDLSEDFSTETAIVFGELYRYNSEWKFSAVGQGYTGGLAALCDRYGIDVG